MLGVGMYARWGSLQDRMEGRLRDALRTVREKKIELLALSGVRWPGHGGSQLEDAAIMYTQAC